MHLHRKYWSWYQLSTRFRCSYKTRCQVNCPSLNTCGQCAGGDLAAAGAPRPPPRLLEPDPGGRRALPLPRNRAPATAAGQPAPPAAGGRGQSFKRRFAKISQSWRRRPIRAFSWLKVLTFKTLLDGNCKIFANFHLELYRSSCAISTYETFSKCHRTRRGKSGEAEYLMRITKMTRRCGRWLRWTAVPR